MLFLGRHTLATAISFVCLGDNRTLSRVVSSAIQSSAMTEHKSTGLRERVPILLQKNTDDVCLANNNFPFRLKQFLYLSQK